MSSRHRNINVQCSGFILAQVIKQELWITRYGYKGQMGQKIYGALSEANKSRVSPQQCQRAYIHFSKVVERHKNGTPWPTQIPGICGTFYSTEYADLVRDLGIWKNAVDAIQAHHTQITGEAHVDGNQVARPAATTLDSQEQQSHHDGGSQNTDASSAHISPPQTTEWADFMNTLITPPETATSHYTEQRTQSAPGEVVNNFSSLTNAITQALQTVAADMSANIERLVQTQREHELEQRRIAAAQRQEDMAQHQLVLDLLGKIYDQIRGSSSEH